MGHTRDGTVEERVDGVDVDEGEPALDGGSSETRNVERGFKDEESIR